MTRTVREVVEEMRRQTPTRRERDTAHVVFEMPRLTDEGMAQLALYIDALPKRSLDSEVLAEAQREREMP